MNSVFRDKNNFQLQFGGLDFESPKPNCFVTRQTSQENVVTAKAFITVTQFCPLGAEDRNMDLNDGGASRGRKAGTFQRFLFGLLLPKSKWPKRAVRWK